MSQDPYGQQPPSPYSQQPSPSPYSQPSYGASPYGQPAPAGYEATHLWEQDRRRMIGGKHAQTGLVLGIVGTAVAAFFGWIPILGMLAVAAGVGCGIPAIIQGRKAEPYNVSGRAGIILGWAAIVISAGWTALYMLFMVLGAIGSSRGY